MDAICRRELCRRISVRSRIGTGEIQRCIRPFGTTIPRPMKSKPKNTKKPQVPQNTAGTARVIKPYETKLPKHQPQISKSGQRATPATAPMKEIRTKDAAPKPPPKTPVNPLLDSNRRIPLLGAGIMVFCIAGYIGYFATALSKTPSAAPSVPSAQADVSVRYDKIARKFDTSVDFTEISMGMPKKRRELVSDAHGDVLEVSVGTGRNLEFFDWDFEGHNGVGEPMKGGGVKRGSVRSLTAIDISKEMVEVAKEKFDRRYPGMPKPRWVVGDASREIPPPPQHLSASSPNMAAQKYDTIVQTMGLCSVSDPVALLQNLGNHVKEDEGRILLLEHGRGSWSWVNYLLDKTAIGHALEHGCWWNRDIQAIIKESGLEVVKTETWHAGTTWRIELKKPKQLGTEKLVQKEADARHAKDEKKGWGLW